MPTEATLGSLIERLEKATIRLEATVSKGGSTSTISSANVASSGNVAASSEVGGVQPAVVALDELYSSYLTPWLEKSSQIGDIVKTQSELVRTSFETLRQIVTISSTSKKPPTPQTFLQPLFQPCIVASEQATKLKDSSRSHPQFNHASCVAEGLGALGWVFVEKTPSPFVGDMKDAAKFYADRVLKEFKSKDENHVEWANGFIKLLSELAVYVRKFHTTGLAWNPKGTDFISGGSASSGGPPPPAPPAPSAASASSAPAPSRSNLFAELNKGGDITSGLKKVEKSQMTHKNPELRASSVVKATDKPTNSVTQKGTVEETSKPPKRVLEGRTWMIENYQNDKTLCLEAGECELKQKVHIYNCEGCTIQIKGKVNAVILLKCKKTAVVVQEVVSCVEVVDSKTLQLQILAKCPTLSADKTDGLQVYLSKSSLDTEIMTAKSSEINVSVPGLKEGDDWVEKPIPEQFKSVVKGGVIVTVPIEHSGG